jgi:hypothetical protein
MGEEIYFNKRINIQISNFIYSIIKLNILPDGILAAFDFKYLPKITENPEAKNQHCLAQAGPPPD